MKNFLKIVIVSAALSALSSGCTFVPNSGPSVGAISRSGEHVEPMSQQEGGKVESSTLAQRTVIFDVNENTTSNLLKFAAQNQFAETWRESVTENVIGIGDVLQVAIWEAPPAVLFGGATNQLGLSSGKSVELPAQMVDQAGRITVPFIGQVAVHGKSLRQAEVEIAARLSRMANQPQVMVTPMKNNSANVTVISDGGGVRMPLTARGERILDAISALGGVKSAEKATIQVTRGTTVKSMPLSAITRDPRQNILLKAGDVVTATNEPNSFIVLGAAGRNEEINFEGQGITLAQAFGRARGLDPSRADSSGIFVFRFEDPKTVEQMGVAMSDTQKLMKVPVVYRADLSDPSALFYAQNFTMHDKDVIFVADASSVRLQKFLSLINSAIGPLSNLATGINDASAAAARLNN